MIGPIHQNIFYSIFIFVSYRIIAMATPIHAVAVYGRGWMSNNSGIDLICCLGIYTIRIVYGFLMFCVKLNISQIPSTKLTRGRTKLTIYIYFLLIMFDAFLFHRQLVGLLYWLSFLLKLSGVLICYYQVHIFISLAIGCGPFHIYHLFYFGKCLFDDEDNHKFKRMNIS